MWIIIWKNIYDSWSPWPGPRGCFGASFESNPCPLHSVVCGPSAALWADPVDVLGEVLDVARLAVDAVLRVDHQAHPLLPVLASHVLVHACKSEKVL